MALVQNCPKQSGLASEPFGTGPGALHAGTVLVQNGSKYSKTSIKRTPNQADTLY